MNTNLVVEMVGGESYEYAPLGQHIVRAVGVCGGRPTVKYTRIEMSHLLDRIAQGDSIEEITGDYSQRVSREAVAEAIEITNRFFAASLSPLTPERVERFEVLLLERLESGDAVPVTPEFWQNLWTRVDAKKKAKNGAEAKS